MTSGRFTPGGDPGTGRDTPAGLPRPRLDQLYRPPHPQVPPGTSAGILRAREVIIAGQAPGLFVYNGAATLGNLLLSITPPATTTDPPGNQIPGAGLNVGQWNPGGTVAAHIGANASGLFVSNASNVVVNRFLTSGDITLGISGSGGIIHLLQPSGDTTGAQDRIGINNVLAGSKVLALLPGATYYIDQQIAVPDQGCITALCESPSWGVPSGNYGVSGLTLQGAIIRAGSLFSGGSFLAFNPSLDAVSQHGGQRLYGITLDGHDLGGGNTTHAIASFGHVAGVKMRDVAVWGGFGGDGLHIANDGTAGHNPDSWQVESCIFRNVLGYGVGISASLGNSWFTDCEVSNCGAGGAAGGWLVTNGGDTRFTSCRANASTGPGWTLSGVTGFTGSVQLTGCSGSANSTFGFSFSGSGTGIYYLANCQGSANTSGVVSYAGTNGVRTAGGNFTVWLPLTLANGWANLAAGPAAQWRWDGEEAEFIGAVTAGTITAGTTIFNLPTGTAPAHTQVHPLLDTTTGTAQAHLNFGSGGTATFTQGIGTVAAADTCYFHAFVSTTA